MLDVMEPFTSPTRLFLLRKPRNDSTRSPYIPPEQTDRLCVEHAWCPARKDSEMFPRTKAFGSGPWCVLLVSGKYAVKYSVLLVLQYDSFFWGLRLAACANYVTFGVVHHPLGRWGEGSPGKAFMKSKTRSDVPMYA